MTPNILEAMGWFKESSEFVWFDLGEFDIKRNDVLYKQFEVGNVPALLHTGTLPSDIPMPFEQMALVVSFVGFNGQSWATVVTLHRSDNTMQVTFRHPKGEKLILTHVGENSLKGEQDLWYDGDSLERLLKSPTYKDKPDPENAIVSTHTDIARRIYGMLYLELVNKKSQLPSYRPLPNPANPKRISKGKKPLFEWKVIDITATHVKPENSQPTNRTHASPRRHIRRGHMRRYKSGKIAWVRQTMVGSIEFGYIHHSYTTESKGVTH